MIKCMRVKPGEVDALRDWMTEAMARQDEVLETFEQETIRHEMAILLDGNDGPVLVYGMEVEDYEVARAAFLASQLPIDRQHRQVMSRVLDGPAEVEQLMDIRARP